MIAVHSGTIPYKLQVNIFPPKGPEANSPGDLQRRKASCSGSNRVSRPASTGTSRL